MQPLVRIEQKKTDESDEPTENEKGDNTHVS